MAFLASCWFIIETVIIPDGFRKWFYLSFFIHPLILFFCQIFLWLRLLKRCLVVVLGFPLRTICAFCLYIFGLCKKCVIFLFSFTRFYKGEAEEEVEQYFEAQPRFSSNLIADSYTRSIAASIRCEIKLLEAVEDVFEEAVDYAEDSLLYEDHNMERPMYLLYSSNSFTTNENSNGFLFQIQKDYAEGSILSEDTLRSEYSLCSSNSFAENEYPSIEVLPLCGSNSNDRDLCMDEHSPTAYDPDFQLIETEVTTGEDKEESDGFYNMYNERMRWFDVLNYDRTCGISAIEGKQLGNPPSPFKTIEHPDSAGDLNMNSWSKMTKRRLLRSLESDFEMIYVAQSCLSWEALHHQYRKVKAIECSSSQNNNIFCSIVAGEFQKFQVLLERFTEDEQSEGKRVWNYVQGRYSFKSLLQVPEFSIEGFMKENKEEMKGQGTNVKGVLNAVEECIEAFWLFVKADNNKKSWWKTRSFYWAYPPVEDPRDLGLLAELTKRLQKNNMWLKNLQGKKRCLLKRIVNPMEESQRKEMLFTMIDMKLVSRVIQMSVVSSSQLKWCQEKLDNVEFKDGKLVRACNYPLFPP